MELTASQYRAADLLLDQIDALAAAREIRAGAWNPLVALAAPRGAGKTTILEHAAAARGARLVRIDLLEVLLNRDTIPGATADLLCAGPVSDEQVILHFEGLCDCARAGRPEIACELGAFLICRPVIHYAADGRKRTLRTGDVLPVVEMDLSVNYDPSTGSYILDPDDKEALSPIGELAMFACVVCVAPPSRDELLRILHPDIIKLKNLAGKPVDEPGEVDDEVAMSLLSELPPGSLHIGQARELLVGALLPSAARRERRSVELRGTGI